MAANRNLLTLEQTQEFIQQLASRMDAKSGDRINIQMGKNSVYEGVVGQEPEMSKLTDTRVGVLRAAMDMDAPAIGQKGEASNLKQAIILEKNEQEVFRFEKGQVIESKLVEPEIEINEVDVVSQENNSVIAFESVTPFEIIKNGIEASNLPEDSNIRSSTQQFVQEKERQAQVQREENAKNWQWFQMSKLEDRQGAYHGSVSIDAIQERSDRDSFFSDLMDLLRSNDYVRTASNAAKPLNTDKQARSNKPIASVLRPFLARLKQGTQLPIFLPSHLPIKNIYACLDIINTNEYMVNIGSIGGDGQKDCSPSTAAYVGSISAFRGEKIQEPTQKVRLSNNISAYYAPRSYKVPPSIYWTYKNVLYQINMKEYADGKDRNPAEAKAYLIKLANSAIEAGQR